MSVGGVPDSTPSVPRTRRPRGGWCRRARLWWDRGLLRPRRHRSPTLEDPRMNDLRPATHGVHSEVGRLRKVLVCRPGLAHRRLTPTNSADLLFDDVMWVGQAERDHADFVDKLTERGVEVVELHDLLAETMAIPAARDWLLDRKIVANHVGLGPRRQHAGLPRDPRAGAARGVPHRRSGHPRPAGGVPYPVGDARSGADRGTRVPHAAAPQHAVHPRHDLLGLRRAHPQPAVLAGARERDPHLQGDLQLPPGLPGLDDLVGRPGGRLGRGDARGRRRDAGRQRRRPASG